MAPIERERFCKACGKQIPDIYDFTNYVYKIVKHNHAAYFCGWTCYKGWMNEHPNFNIKRHLKPKKTTARRICRGNEKQPNKNE